MVFLFDFLIISLAFSLSRKLGFGLAINEEQFNAFLLIFSLCWIIAGFDKIYHLNKFTLIRTIGIQLFAILIVHVALIVGILFLIKTFSIDINFLLCVYALTIVLIIISRIAYKVLSKYFEFSGFDQRRFVIIGATQTGKSIQNFFASHAFNRYHFRGFFDDLTESQYCDKSLIKGRMKDLKDFCIQENIDEIYFALALTEKDLFEDIRKFADDNCIYLRFAPDFSSVVKDNYNLMMYDSMPILTTRKEPLGVSVNAALKRAFDIAFSLTIILTVFPFVVPIIAFAIRLNSRGPIIFKQLRPGKKNKLFECYKFRTMAVNNSAEFQATKNDPRVTSVGKFLRKTNLSGNARRPSRCPFPSRWTTAPSPCSTAIASSTT
jgi:putative colanic acid biosynthesis UDP-glucose lipid carrier transferase